MSVLEESGMCWKSLKSLDRSLKSELTGIVAFEAVGNHDEVPGRSEPRGVILGLPEGEVEGPIQVVALACTHHNERSVASVFHE